MKKSTVIGNLDIITLASNNFTNESQMKRKVRIWTPTNYDKNENKLYPVIYFHDGQNIFDEATSYSGEWEADETISNLISSKFDGAILVGIDNTIERLGEYTYNLNFLDTFYNMKINGKKYKDLDIVTNEYLKTGHEYLNFVINVLKPYVDQNYNTLKDRNNTTIAGSSMGGLISLFGGLEHLNIFGNIIAYSTTTGLVRDEYELIKYFNNLNPIIKDTKFYFYVGDSNDGDINWPKRYKKLLINAGAKEENIIAKIGKGFSHNEHAWKVHLPETLKWIFNLD